MLVSTHQLAELAAIVDQLAVLHEGRLVHYGPAADLVTPGETLESAVFDLLAEYGSGSTPTKPAVQA